MQGNSTCPVTVPRDKRATRLVPLCLCLKSRCAALGSRLGWTCSAPRPPRPVVFVCGIQRRASAETRLSGRVKIFNSLQEVSEQKEDGEFWRAAPDRLSSW